MKYKKLLLHGINEIEVIDQKNILHRLPLDVRSNLESPGTVSSANNGSEIRFYITGETKISLSTLSERATVIVYFGDYQHELYYIKKDESLDLVLNPNYDKSQLERIVPLKHRFHPNIVRLILFETISIDEVSGSYRYPEENEMPNKKYLAYGTSITQGRRGLGSDMTYPGIFSELIGYDVYNYGMSGCCFIEDKMIAFLANQKYDLITLCLSVNMLGRGYTLEEFETRTRKLLTALRKTNPLTPIILISILTNWRDVGLTKPVTSNSTALAYRTKLQQIGLEYNHTHFLDGTKALSINHLASDILHPGNYGLIEIAYRLNELYVREVKK